VRKFADSVLRDRDPGSSSNLKKLSRAIYHLGYAKCQLNSLDQLVEATVEDRLRDVLGETMGMYDRTKTLVEAAAQYAGLGDIEF